MSKSRLASRLSVAAAAFASVVALGGGVAVAQSPDTAFEIHFDARAGDRPLVCGARYEDIGSSHASILLQDFRIYVSNVRLIARDGREQPLNLIQDDLWQGDQVALLDFEDATGNCNGNQPTNRVIRGRAPEGDYVGLVFDIGVPVALNHQDPTLASAPLNFSALTWPWRTGYKFTNIDLETGVETGAGNAMSVAGHAASGFSIHLGNVDCGRGSPRVAPETPCATQNRPEYRLESFNPDSQLVVFDLAALLSQTDVTVNDPGTASGCMSGDDDDCVSVFEKLGLPFRDQASRGQSFVRVSGR